MKLDFARIESRKRGLKRRDLARRLLRSCLLGMCPSRTVGRDCVRDVMRTLRRQDPHRHKLWMSGRPGKRRLLALKESIDHDRVALRGGSARRARGRAVHHTRPAVNGNTLEVGKNNMAPVRDPFWIDRDMARAQSRAIRTSAKLPFPRPIDRNPSKQRRFGGKRRRRE